MSFNPDAFGDTLATITADLRQVGTAVAWFAPCAYEQRSGGRGGPSATCGECGGSGIVLAGRPRAGEPCNECVVATVGDAGEIVLRREHLAHVLDLLADDAEKMWLISKRMVDRVARVASIIDAGASGDDRWGPPTADWREVADARAARARRLERGEQPPGIADVERAADEAFRNKRATEERLAAAAAKAGGGKGGNRWRR